MKNGINRRDFIAGATVGVAGLMLASTAEAKPPVPKAAAQPAAYKAPNTKQELDNTQLFDLEESAAKVLKPAYFAFIARGAEKEWTLKENTRAFDRYEILPQYLSGKSAPDTRITLLGQDLSLPVITTPMGAQGLAHTSAELGVAEGTAAAGTLMTVSTAANTRIEDIAAATKGPKWFQLYLEEGDRSRSKALLQKAKASGYSAVVFTVDAFAPGSSDAVSRLGFTFPPNLSLVNASGSTFKKSLSWDDVAFIRDSTDLPLILKGLVSPDIVEQALKNGVAGFQVSNHGGRQLDGVPAAITALPGVVKAVGGQVPIIMDSGIRRGSDVFKALALGASAVAFGRPVLYGLALGGAQGVASVYAQLQKELVRTMTIAGVASVKEITREFLVERERG